MENKNQNKNTKDLETEQIVTSTIVESSNTALPNKKSPLKTRIIVGSLVAVVYIAVMLLTTLITNFPRIFFDVFVISVVIVASLEMCSAVGKRFSKPIKAMVIATIIVGFAAFYLTHFLFSYNQNEERGSGITAFFFAVAFMLLVIITVNVFLKNHTMQNVLSTMFVLVYPTMLGVYLLALNYFEPYGIANAAILLVFIVPAFADTGAFFIGSKFRGPLLAPNISPKKTISGAVGGVVCGIAGGALVFVFSHFGVFNVGILNEVMGINLIHFLLLGGFGAIFTILGDLIASYVKRQCGVKDFGVFLPGHGGILDRIDGMMLTAVFLFIYFFVLTFFFG